MLRAISNDGPPATEHVDELCSRFIESFVRRSPSRPTASIGKNGVFVNVVTSDGDPV